MFQKRKQLVQALIDEGKVVKFSDGYVLVPTFVDFVNAVDESLHGAAVMCDGYVTTLDVKNTLREHGFLATQAVVSQWMHHMADDGLLTKQDMGPYHRFFPCSAWEAGVAVTNSFIELVK